MIILMPLLLLVLWALAGCDEDPETECGAARPAEDGSCPLTLRFEPEEMQQTATRAADENAIRDLTYTYIFRTEKQPPRLRLSRITITSTPWPTPGMIWAR